MKFLFIALLSLGSVQLSAQVVDKLRDASDQNLSTGAYSVPVSSAEPVYYAPPSPSTTVSLSDPYPIPDPATFEPGEYQPAYRPARRNHVSSGGQSLYFPEPMSMDAQFQLGLQNRPAYFYLEFTPQAGVSPQYTTLLGQLRLGYGWGSTSIRYYNLIEMGRDFLANYRTIDWQIFRARLVERPWLQWHVGLGVMYEQYNDVFYPEFTTEVGVNAMQGKLYIPVEFRATVDDITGAWVRQEINVQGNYRLMEDRHYTLSATAGYFFQYYYESVRVQSPTLGLRMLLF